MIMARRERGVLGTIVKACSDSFRDRKPKKRESFASKVTKAAVRRGVKTFIDW
jgi:hypothetical protein